MNAKHFVIIDDDPINNLITKAVLKSSYANAEIFAFTDPEIGLAHIENNVAALDMDTSVVLLLDINMPTMTGWEVLDCFDTMDEAVISRLKVFMLSSSVHI